jgi:hypothetical protein
VRREHDDESGDARHDAPGQRHGRSGNAGRIACVAIGLLSRKPASRRPRVKRYMQRTPRAGPILKWYLVVRLFLEAYVFC